MCNAWMREEGVLRQHEDQSLLFAHKSKTYDVTKKDVLRPSGRWQSRSWWTICNGGKDAAKVVLWVTTVKRGWQREGPGIRYFSLDRYATNSQHKHGAGFLCSPNSVPLCIFRVLLSVFLS